MSQQQQQINQTLMDQYFTEEEILFDEITLKNERDNFTHTGVIKGMFKLKYENYRIPGSSAMEFCILQFMVKHNLFLLLKPSIRDLLLHRTHSDSGAETDLMLNEQTSDSKQSSNSDEFYHEFLSTTDPLLGKRDRLTPSSSPSKVQVLESATDLTPSLKLTEFNSYKTNIKVYFLDVLDEFRTFLENSARLIMINNRAAQELAVQQACTKRSRVKKTELKDYDELHSLNCFTNAKYTLDVFISLFSTCRSFDSRQKKPCNSFGILMPAISRWNREVIYRSTQDKLVVVPAFLTICNDSNALSVQNHRDRFLEGCCQLLRFIRHCLEKFMASEQFQNLVKNKQVQFHRTEFMKQEDRMRALERLIEEDVGWMLIQSEASQNPFF
jgi:hypothetical protein